MLPRGAEPPRGGQPAGKRRLGPNARPCLRNAKDASGTGPSRLSSICHQRTGRVHSLDTPEEPVLQCRRRGGKCGNHTYPSGSRDLHLQASRGDRSMRLTLPPCFRWIIPAVLVLIPMAASAQDPGALSAVEEASLQELRDFASLTAERYRMVAPLEISVASWVGNPSLPQYASSPAVYTGGQLYVNRRL